MTFNEAAQPSPVSFPLFAQWEHPEELLCRVFLHPPLPLLLPSPFCFPLALLFKAVSRLLVRGSFSSQGEKKCL